MTLLRRHPLRLVFMMLLALVIGGASVPGAGRPANAQGTPAPLIPLPDAEPFPGDAFVDPLDLSDDRFAADRRVPSATDTGAHVDWVAPLRPQRVSRMQRGLAWRFTGEHHVEDFTLFVSDPALSRTLRIRTLSTVNVLPERSSGRVLVNGVEVGVLRLSNFTDFGSVDLELPAMLLQQGQNTVRIEVHQHHRIFCGPDASWALWTEVDFANSGLVVDTADISPGIGAFLMGIAADSVSLAGIEMRGTEGLGGARDAWVSALVTRLNRVMAGRPLNYRFTEFWSLQPDRPARARVTFMPSDQAGISFHTGGDGAQVMLVEYVPGSGPSQFEVLDHHVASAPRTPRPELIDTAREVAFSEFGFETVRFAERYARREYTFRLADDWLVLTAEKARIRLDYQYAEELPEGSMLLLGMNGTTIRMLPLRDEPGQFIERFPVDFEARLMHAGNNVLSVEMLIPGDPPDLPCAASRGPVLEIAETSTLSVPFSPSMHMPDMMLAFTSLAPESLRVNELTPRAFSADDQITLATALSQGRTDYRPGALHLLAIEDLGALPVGQYRVDRRILESVLTVRPEHDPDEAQFAESAYDPFRGRWFDGSDGRAALATWWDSFMRTSRDFVQWLNPRTENRLNEWLAQQHGQAMLLQLDHDTPDQIWMLRSRDSDVSDIAAAIIAARFSGEGPRGQVSVLGHDGLWTSWMAPDRHPRMLEPWRLSNFRSAMGNIVSARPIKFVVILFFLAVISAAVALRLIVSTREHDE